MADTSVWTLSCHDSGSSTSDLAKAAALAGASSGAGFLLYEQTAGRGRRGRQWASQRGGMYVSVLLYPSQPLARWFAMSFAAALAVYDAVTAHLVAQINQHDMHQTGPQIGLKWPNDVLVNNRKIAGILLEAEGDRLIIGSGINIARITHHDDNPHPPIAFGDFPGTLPPPEMLANSYLARLRYYYELCEEQGFAPLRKIWMKHALHIGKIITVSVAGHPITGVCEDIDHDGVLVLLDETGHRHHITTGDVELIGS